MFLLKQPLQGFGRALVKLDPTGEVAWETSFPSQRLEAVYAGPRGELLVTDLSELYSLSNDGTACTRWQFDSELFYAPQPEPPDDGPVELPPPPRLFCDADYFCSAPRFVWDREGLLYAAGPDLIARLRLTP